MFRETLPNLAEKKLGLASPDLDSFLSLVHTCLLFSSRHWPWMSRTESVRFTLRGMLRTDSRSSSLPFRSCIQMYYSDLTSLHWLKDTPNHVLLRSQKDMFQTSIISALALRFRDLSQQKVVDMNRTLVLEIETLKARGCKQTEWCWTFYEFRYVLNGETTEYVNPPGENWYICQATGSCGLLANAIVTKSK